MWRWIIQRHHQKVLDFGLVWVLCVCVRSRWFKMTRSNWCLLICSEKVTVTSLSPGPVHTSYRRNDLASLKVHWSNIQDNKYNIALPPSLTLSLQLTGWQDRSNLTMDEKTGRKRVAVATLLVHSVKTAIIREITVAMAHGGIDPSGVIWWPSQAESPELCKKKKWVSVQWGLEALTQKQGSHTVGNIPVK